MRSSFLAATAVGFALALPTAGSAASVFFADLDPLPNLSARGLATLNLNDTATQLTVSIDGTGFTPNMVHPAHIHGLVADDGTPIEANVPTIEQDTDNDGFVELAEGLVTYGPILVPLVDDMGMFPTANAEGEINFSEMYDLTDSASFADGIDVTSLLPLMLREIVVHGAFVEEGIGAGTEGEVNGTGGYVTVLPVVAGEIAPIPLPAAGWALMGGLGALFGVSRRRRRTAV